MGSDLALSHTALRLAKRTVLRLLSRAFGGGRRRFGNAFRRVRHRFTRTRHSRAPVVEPTCGDALKNASARLRS